jgi:hypothetical protein
VLTPSGGLTRDLLQFVPELNRSGFMEFIDMTINAMEPLLNYIVILHGFPYNSHPLTCSFKLKAAEGGVGT